jgi:hypothetical protein
VVIVRLRYYKKDGEETRIDIPLTRVPCVGEHVGFMSSENIQVFMRVVNVMHISQDPVVGPVAAIDCVLKAP